MIVHLSKRQIIFEAPPPQDQNGCGELPHPNARFFAGYNQKRALLIAAKRH